MATTLTSLGFLTPAHQPTPHTEPDAGTPAACSAARCTNLSARVIRFSLTNSFNHKKTPPPCEGQGLFDFYLPRYKKGQPLRGQPLVVPRRPRERGGAVYIRIKLL